MDSSGLVKIDTSDQSEHIVQRPKNNCFILVGVGIQDLRLTQKQVGSKSKTIFDSDWGWCFSDRLDAENVAKKYSKNGKDFKVRSFFSEKAERMWHGTKLEKKAAMLETQYIIKKRAVDEAEASLRCLCHKQKVDFSWLDESAPPADFDDREKQAFEYLKPQFEEWKISKDECKVLENNWTDAEEEVLEEKRQSLINPHDWPFHVLGYTNAREVVIWHQGQVMHIKAREIGMADIKLLIGTQSGQHWESTRDAIIADAHRKGKIDEDKPLQTGVWKLKDKWLVISGHRALVIDQNNSITLLDHPIFDGKIIKLDRREWIDWDHFKSIYGKIKFNEIYDKVLAKVSAWNWSESEMAAYATAFVLLSPLQQAMTWRPWLHLTGAKSTGKSSFFIHILQSLYGCLTQRLDKSTGFATAQTIGNTCKIPIFDEFEKNPKHITDILEMGKLCNAGGVKTSGRPNEKALEYEFHHLLWFGSIYKPAQMTQDGAQESRIVTLELKKLKDTTPILDEFEEEGHKIAAEIVAAMIFQWDEIQAKAKSIAQNRKDIMKKCPGIEIRTVDNFMYASAVLNLATQKRDAYTVPNWTSPTNEDDGEKILLTILHSRIKFNTNEHRMVSELVKLAEVGDTYPRGLLQQNGISIAKIKDKLYLAIRPQLVVKFLLKDDEYYRSLDISAPLGRIDGVEKNIGVRFGNQGTLKSIIIPMQHVNSVCGFEGQPEECISSEGNAGNGMETSKVTPYVIDNELNKDIRYQNYQENNRPYSQECSFK